MPKAVIWAGLDRLNSADIDALVGSWPAAAPTSSKKRRAQATVEGLKGSLYLSGGVWWVKYRQHGQVKRESTGSADQHAAEKLLLKRSAAAALSHHPGDSRCP